MWAPPEQIDQGQFALEVAVKVLEYYEDLFKVKYPLPKQDLVAIPDFAAGAMENWGLITYRLTSLLYKKNKSSDSNKERVAVVVAHELAHQWFGNLVTMEWWNDLWLNEGFASFMEFMGVNHTQPDWKMMELSIYENFQGAMSEDQLSNSHPIMAEVKDPAQINALFDSISYDKGAAIIRMLEDVLGSEVFFQGLQKYLKKYSYSNAQTNDLWQSLTQESISSEGEINVTEMMTSWTSQMGFPVISVKRENKILHIEQQHFLVHSNDKQLTASSSDSRPMWVVPLTFVTQQSKNRSLVLMKKRTIEVKLSPDLSDKSWIKMNAGQTGFYRVNYEKENWDKLVRYLHTEAKVLSTVDRSGLLDDALNLARSGMLDYEVALNLTSYLTKEKEYVPWMSALDNMGYFAIQFSTYDSLKGSSDYYPTYKKYVSYLLHDIAAELSWEEKDDDPHLRRYLRPALLKMAAIYEDVLPESKQRYTAKAKKYFNDWLDKGKPISPNVRYAIYTIGLRVANDSVWTKVFYRYQTETVPSEKKKLMYALTTSQNEVILKRLLKYSLDETKIRSQDSVSVIDSIARNPQGSLLAWQFVQDNYHELYQRYGVGSFDFSRLITSNTAHFNTEEMKTQVSQFFAKVNQGSGERAVRQSLESIEGNIKWMKDHGPAVNKWLKNFLN